MVKVERNHWRLSSPTFLIKQDSLKHISKDGEYIQRGRLHSHSGYLVPVLSHSHSKWVLPHIQVELQKAQDCLLRSCTTMPSATPWAWGVLQTRLCWHESTPSSPQFLKTLPVFNYLSAHHCLEGNGMQIIVPGALEGCSEDDFLGQKDP